MRALLEQLKEANVLSASSPADLAAAMETQDILQTQRAMLSAMLLSAETSGSLGSALVPDHTSGDAMRGHTLHTREEESFYVPVRPLIRTDDWFETTWQEFNRIRGL